MERRPLSPGSRPPAAEIYQIEADFENIVCQRGDLVYVEHDVTGWGVGSARITAVTTSNSKVTSITVDDVIYGNGSNLCVARIRCHDGSQFFTNTTIPTAGASTFAVYNPGATTRPAVGDLVLFGTTTTIPQQLLVLAIEFKADLQATLYLQDYVPAIYTAESNYNPQSSGASGQVVAAAKAQIVISSAPTIVGVRSDITVMNPVTGGSWN